MILCRLEYLTPDGSWAVLATHELMHPDRYAKRLEAAGKVARAAEVAGKKRTWTSSNVPADPSVLVPVPHQGRVPFRLPCPHCEGLHMPPFSGDCLL